MKHLCFVLGLVWCASQLGWAQPDAEGAAFARAVFLNGVSQGVQGQVTFAQANRTAPTIITLEFVGLPSDVNQLIIGIQRVVTNQCVASPRFSPTPVMNHIIPCTPTTLEGCPLGAITGRFGPLTNGVRVITDHNMTMYGFESIMGHGMFLETATNTPVACANIVPTRRVRRAVATFPPESLILGTVTLEQDYDQSDAATTIITLVDYNRGLPWSIPSTGTAHQWDVTIAPVTDDNLASTPDERRCLSTGSALQDTITTLDNMLKNTTDAAEVERLCRLETLIDKQDCLSRIGNLSRLHGDLIMPTNAVNTNIFMPLSGPFSVIGKSVRVEASDQSPYSLACATFEEVAPTMIETVFVDGGVSGSIRFEQFEEFSPTTITAYTQGATDTPNPWHIHQFPLQSAQPSTVCATAGGHYNPSSVDATASNYTLLCNPLSPFKYSACELGDLTGRWGPLANALNVSFLDFNTPLFGPQAVQGRSVVLHSNATGARVGCANIGRSTPEMLTAVATFTGPEMVGTMTLRQPANDPLAATTILVDVSFINVTQSMTGLAWSVHQNAVGSDQFTSGSNRCDSVGGVYKGPSDLLYSGTCSPTCQRCCLLGKLYEKHGRLNVPSRVLYTDERLPLSGNNSVVGRSILVNNEPSPSGPSHLGCALIKLVPVASATAAFVAGESAGIVTFSQGLPEDPTVVSVNVVGPAADTALVVHANPLTTADGSCPAAELGPLYAAPLAPNSGNMCTSASPYLTAFGMCPMGNLVGKHGPFGNTLAGTRWIDYHLPLWGTSSIVGRPLAVHRGDASGEIVSCAVINGEQATTTVRAVFPADSLLIGSVTVRQGASTGALIIVDLAYAGDASAATSLAHQWHIHTLATGDDASPSAPSTCASTGPHFNPLAANVSSPTYATACSVTSLFGCEIGDLSGKFGTIALPGRYVFTDPTLTSAYNLTNLSLTVHAANGASPRIACATFVAVNPRVLTTVFASGGQTGSVTMTQTLPTDATMVTTASIGGFVGGPNPWHVHAFPSLNRGCGASQVGGHYNPLNAPSGNATQYTQGCNPSSPTRFRDCEIGDLSNKLGALVSGTHSYMAHNLPLQGRLSVQGRSVVVHSGTDGARLGCGNIGYPSADMITAIAQIDVKDAVAASITFRQPAGQPNAEVTILVEVELRPGHSGAQSSGHNWHVHVNRVASDGNCASAGGHYNPLGVNTTQPAYSTRCTPIQPYACELGDLSGKHGALDFPTRVMYTDVQLPLSGPNSIVGRSVVIHASNGGSTRLGCADIVQYLQREAIANFYLDGFAGGVKFTQTYEADPVTVFSFMLGYTGSRALSVQQFPVPASGQCSSTLLGGLYAPHAITSTGCTPATPSNQGLCSVGNLSGKGGLLPLSTGVTYTDYALTLWGVSSIVGRSAVLSSTTALGAPAAACATIAYPPERSVGTTVSLELSLGAVTGTVTMRTVFGRESTVFVELSNSGSNDATNLTWSVDTNADCSAGSVYNPLNVASTLDCSPDSPQLCAIGDFSRKFGALSVAAHSSVKYFFTDTQLPLQPGASFTIIGRGLAFANTCQSIELVVPRTVTATVAMAGVYGTLTFSQDDAASPTHVAAELHGNATSMPWSINVLPDTDRYNCDASGIGSVYNPANVSTSSWEYQTFCIFFNIARYGACPVGDMTGKHGPVHLNAKPTWDDYSLTLWGANSIVGRSLLLSSPGVPSVCATLGYPVPVQQIDTAVARFTSSSFQGSMVLRQATGDAVTVLVDLWSSIPYARVSWTLHSGTCSSSSTSAIVYNFSQTAGVLTLPALGSQRYYATVSGLSLTAVVGGTSLVLVNPENGQQIGCAELQTMPERRVTAHVDMVNGVRGTVEFAQTYATDPVQVNVSLTGLHSSSNTLSVHTLPSLNADTGNGVADPADCPSTVLNPLNALNTNECSPSSPSKWLSCAMGDISGKLGTIPTSGLLSGISDPTLSLFGRFALSRRSIVIQAQSGANAACGTIGYFGTVTSVAASFSSPVLGTLTMRQVASAPWAETTLEWSLQSSDASQASTVVGDHTWLVADTCSASVYNPTGISVAASSVCTAASAALTCAVGDESGKHGALAVPSGGMQLAVDTALPLTGVFSVDGKSLVVDGVGCEALQEQPARVATATFTGTAASSMITGTVTMTQAYAGEATRIEASLSGLPAGGANWYVYTLPVQGNTCGSDATGQLFNPTGSGIGVGDLTARVGMLTSQTLVDNAAFVLPLFGEGSVVLRSLVLVDPTTGSPLACATIERSGVTVQTGRVTFDNGQLRGSVTFSQVLGDPTSDTTIHVDVGLSTRRRATAINGGQYAWGIRDGSCASTVSYNPTGLSGVGCSPSTPNLCAIGDLSGRYGPLRLPATGADRVLLTDPLLAVQGPLSVLDQFFAVASIANSADLVECASVVNGTTASADVTPPASSNPSSGGISGGAVAAIIVVVLVLLIVIVVAIVVRRRRNRNGSSSSRYRPQATVPSSASLPVHLQLQGFVDNTATLDATDSGRKSQPPPRPASQPDRRLALYEYTPRHQDEIALIAGDSVVVTQVLPDGWLRAKNLRTKKTGLVPANYLEVDVVVGGGTTRLEEGILAADRKIGGLSAMGRSPYDDF